MVAVRPADQERFARRLPAGIEVVLVYGPDAGLAHERCLALVKAAVADVNDPFQLVHLDDRELVAHPERLVEEAGAVALFGDRKAIWVRVAEKPVDRAVKLLLQEPVGTNLVVIEAGDLAKQSALRVACEQSPRAAALPCYVGGTEDAGRLVDAILREAGLAIDAGARLDLIDALGEDRRQARSEIDKLVLYMEPGGTVTGLDVAAIAADAHAVATDGVVDAAFGGDQDALDRDLSRALAEKLRPDALLGAALRHALALAETRAKFDGGEPLAQAMRSMRVFWKRQDVVAAQLRRWTSTSLAGAIAGLDAATLRVRRSPFADESVARAALWRVARRAST